MVAPQKIIGQRLRQERVANGWRQRTLAEKIGTTEGTINRWEQGKNAPDSYYRERLCEVFGKTPDELFGFPQSEQVTSPIDQIAPTIPYAEREQALEKPKYMTIDRMPVIGRDHSIKEILSILRGNDTHFLALVGLPGVGKSELARQVGIEAKTLGYFTYVRTLSLTLETTSPDEVIRLLTDKLKDIPTQVRTLVIVHNCEQVKGLTRVLHDFLDEHKHITILATSRARMSRGDYPIEPLRVPKTKYEPIEKLQTNDTVNLLLASANFDRPAKPVLELTEETAETIAAICIGLDGLPLLLLMVSSWIEELKLQGIYDKLKDRKILQESYSFADDDDTKRHQTIQNLIKWSYDLLDEPARKLFRRLGIFTGTCSIKAIIEICALDDLSKEDHEFTKIIRKLKKHLFISFTNQQVQIVYNIIRTYAIDTLASQNKGEEEEKIIEQFIAYYDTLLAGWIVKYNPRLALRDQVELGKYDALLLKVWQVRLIPDSQALEEYHALIRRERNNLQDAYNFLLTKRLPYVVNKMKETFGEREYNNLLKDFRKYAAPIKISEMEAIDAVVLFRAALEARPPFSGGISFSWKDKMFNDPIVKHLTEFFSRTGNRGVELYNPYKRK